MLITYTVLQPFDLLSSAVFPFQNPVKRDIKSRNPAIDDVSGRPVETMQPKKKRKSSPQSSTIQHTPVPPEHLYAVGGGTV